MTFKSDSFGSCPRPITDNLHVLLAHGGGGRLMHRLIDGVFRQAFGNPLLDTGHDSAIVDVAGGRLAFTTDSYVVQPLFFPGGDIGKLAVCGTVNDLAMSGARPLYLSAGFILEEGLPMETLERVVASMRDTAQDAGVAIITGDTKVVDRNRGDGIYINTAGIGLIGHTLDITPSEVRPEDVVLLSGDIGRHGVAVMSEREGLAFETTIESDAAPLAGLVGRLIADGVVIHCLRDLTRGGLASALVEISEAAKMEIRIEERAIPVIPGVRGACEILGLDPLYVANEGRFIAFVAPSDADRALAILKADELGRDAKVIGRVGDSGLPMVTMTSPIGTHRVIDMLSGEQLPRIC